MVSAPHGERTSGLGHPFYPCISICNSAQAQMSPPRGYNRECEIEKAREARARGSERKSLTESERGKRIAAFNLYVCRELHSGRE